MIYGTSSHINVSQNGSSGRPYVLLVMFYLFFIWPQDLRRPIAMKLCHVISIGADFIMQVQQLGDPPLQNFGAKNMQNLGRFYTTSYFDCEYLHNNSRYPKSESQLIDFDSSRIRRNQSDELWSTIQKLWHMRLDPPKSTFSGDYISALFQI